MTNTELQDSPQVGELAPDFTVPSTSGSDVSLSSFRGKRTVLLAFFPLAFTGTCTKELICFTEDFDQFAGRGVEILPISVDAPLVEGVQEQAAHEVGAIKRLPARRFEGLRSP